MYHILKALRGSHSRNLETEYSDVDYFSVYIENLDYYFGFGGIDARQQNTPENDYVEYELRKYLKLLGASNPNSLESLWVSYDKIPEYTKEYKLIRDCRYLFSTKKIADTFCGYANNQIKRSESLTRDVLLNFEYLESILLSAGVDLTNLHISQDILNKKIVGNRTIKGIVDDYKAIKSVYFRGGRLGQNRKNLIKKHNFDTKNMSVCVMLLLQAKEFFQTGELKVDQSHNKSLLFDIKAGNISLLDIKTMADALFKDVLYLKNASSLPDDVNWEKVDSLCTFILRDFFL